MDYPFYPNEMGSNELDDTCLVVGTINILGMDRGQGLVSGEVVLLPKPPVKAVD